MNKKVTKNKKNLFITFLAIAIFSATIYYILQFPRTDRDKKLQTISSLKPADSKQSWEEYQYLDAVNPSADYDVFSSLSEAEKNSLNRNFIIKIEKCLSLVITHELETQLVYNLSQGSSREAVLRGLLAKHEVFDLIENESSDLLTEEISIFISEFNKNFLQRDDFELPVDMRQYELKVALIDEFLDVADLHLSTDTRKFYLWAAYILNSTAGKFKTTNTNQQLLNRVSKIPIDHLKTEVPLAICEAIDKLAKNTPLKKTIQSQ